MNEIDFQDTGLYPDAQFDFDKVNNFYIHNIEKNARILEISHNIKKKIGIYCAIVEENFETVDSRAPH